MLHATRAATELVKIETDLEAEEVKKMRVLIRKATKLMKVQSI